MFTKNNLLAALARASMTQEALASVLGVNPATLYRKTQGLSEFTRSEIQLIRLALNLSTDEAEAIFFAPELTNT